MKLGLLKRRREGEEALGCDGRKEKRRGGGVRMRLKECILLGGKRRERGREKGYMVLSSPSEAEMARLSCGAYFVFVK